VAFVTAGDRVVYVPNLVEGAALVDLGEGGIVVASDEPDRVWIVVGDPYSGTTAVREVDLAGRVTAGPITLPAGVEPVSGVAGGLVVGSPDGIFLVGRDGRARRVARGTLLGTFGDSVLHEACDANLECAIQVTDLVTGEEQRFERTAESFETASRFGDPLGVSPDGRFIATMTYDDETGDATMHIYDLGAGAVVGRFGRDVAGVGGMVAWSPDGRWLIMANPYGGPSGTESLSSALRIDDGAIFEIDLPSGEYYGMVVVPTAAP
jgi:hypothetical protein